MVGAHVAPWIFAPSPPFPDSPFVFQLQEHTGRCEECFRARLHLESNAAILVAGTEL